MKPDQHGVGGFGGPDGAGGGEQVPLTSQAVVVINEGYGRRLSHHGNHHTA